MRNTREIAVDILLQVEEGGFLKDLLEEKGSSLFDERDYNLLHEIVHGVIQEENYLDYYICQTSKLPFRKIHKPILIILRMSLYQLLFLDRIPQRAAIYEGVELAKQYGNRGSIAFVNGMLRKMSRSKILREEIKGSTPAETLGLQYSHPTFFVEDMIEQIGEEETKKLLIANNKRPPTYVRVNTNLYSREEFLKRVVSMGHGKKTSLSNYAVEIQNLNAILNSPLFEHGGFYVQDLGSIKVAEHLQPKPGDRILDVCASPGGKSINLSLLAPDSMITSGDLTNEKVKVLKDNIERMKLKNIKVLKRDGLQTYPNEIGVYDKILIDAPCSGLGLLRRKPEIRKHRVENDCKELSNVQYKLLKNNFPLLKDKGILCYSTCTLTRKENEEVIDKFIKNTKNISLLDKFIYYPHIHNTDGFKIFLMRKD
ncbi:MAG: 16S rRNA (cytosine(967)-C(5))-methyltransferase RsmB [Tissierellia bacterium]|nr:16S rRNA (cytosine(967)-C(5))-methyltransferase RsmB [Tissierellia bacterium]